MSHYNEKRVAILRENAPLNYEKAKELAGSFGVPIKSIIAKALSLGIEYQKKPVARSTKPQGPTKAALVSEIRQTLNMANRTGDFTKQEIASILNAIRANG